MVLNKMRAVRNAAKDSGYEIDNVSLKKECKPVNVIITASMDASLGQQLLEGIRCLSRYNVAYELDANIAQSEGMPPFFIFQHIAVTWLQMQNLTLNWINCQSFHLDSITSNYRPTSKLCQAIDVVRRVMEEHNCKLYRGHVYKLVPESTRTFSFYKSVNNYIMQLLGNPMVADVLAAHAYPVIRLLSEQSCRIIKQIRIDFNYIEVLPKGFFFNIRKKTFEENPKELVNSPRAFVIYTYNATVPVPRPFTDGKF